MKQIFQSLQNGKTSLEEVPIPSIMEDEILIKTNVSLISAGTEKMLIDFGNSNFVKKILNNKDKVNQVLDKVKTDGLKPTIKAVNSKLNKSIPMGYSSVGVIVEVGSKVNNFKIGDRVLTNGYHAEYIKSKINLCCKIPNNIDDSEAVFGILGSIALQSIRLLNPTLGENIVVIGCGLIGVLTAQILVANGCNVLITDIDDNNLNFAKKIGLKTLNTKDEELIAKSNDFFSDKIVDGVIIAANSKSNNLIHYATKAIRKRGKIILLGISGLNLSRDDFYKKEISFQVSSSYGPGRYEKQYEQKNFDYPVSFVRWTQNRNFMAFLNLISNDKVNIKSLISKEFNIENFSDAYDFLNNKQKLKLGVLLKYNHVSNIENKNLNLLNIIDKPNKNKNTIGFIGSGEFASRTLLPEFSQLDLEFVSIGSQNSISSSFLGKKYKFNKIVSDVNEIINDKNINTVVIASRHDSHFKYLIKSMKAEKNIFIEKPLCLDSDQLDEIKKIYDEKYYSTNKSLYVDFNRRFSPLILKLKSLISNSKSPKNFLLTINAGKISQEHWLLNKEEGGGRLIGEACHFIDLLIFLNNSKINHYNIISTDDQNFTINVKFEDNSVGTIHYFSNGSKLFPKERVEVFFDDKVLFLDNFRSLRGFGFNNFKKISNWSQNKGHREIVKSFFNSIDNKLKNEMSFDDIFNVTKISLDASKKIL